jgi:hypothetical protein
MRKTTAPQPTQPSATTRVLASALLLAYGGAWSYWLALPLLAPRMKPSPRLHQLLIATTDALALLLLGFAAMVAFNAKVRATTSDTTLLACVGIAALLGYQHWYLHAAAARKPLPSPPSAHALLRAAPIGAAAALALATGAWGLLA